MPSCKKKKTLKDFYKSKDNETKNSLYIKIFDVNKINWFSINQCHKVCKPNTHSTTNSEAKLYLNCDIYKKWGLLPHMVDRKERNNST